MAKYRKGDIIRILDYMPERSHFLILDTSRKTIYHTLSLYDGVKEIYHKEAIDRELNVIKVG